MIILPGLEYGYLLIVKTYQDLTDGEQQEILMKNLPWRIPASSNQIFCEYFGHHDFEFELSVKRPV